MSLFIICKGQKLKGIYVYDLFKKLDLDFFEIL